MRGAIFETWIVSELLKEKLHHGLNQHLYFWRDTGGLEVDILIERGEDLIPIEIKSGKTITSDYFKSLKKWRKISENASNRAHLIYAGEHIQTYQDTQVLTWKDIAKGFMHLKT